MSKIDEKEAFFAYLKSLPLPYPHHLILNYIIDHGIDLSQTFVYMGYYYDWIQTKDYIDRLAAYMQFLMTGKISAKDFKVI